MPRSHRVVTVLATALVLGAGAGAAQAAPGDLDTSYGGRDRLRGGPGKDRQKQ